MGDPNIWVIFYKMFPFLAVVIAVIILEVVLIIQKYNDKFYGLKSMIKSIKKCISNNPPRKN